MTIQEIGDNLKENIYKALKKLIDGFFQMFSNRLDRNDSEVFLKVRNNSMVLLFRFLFLLFAEGNGNLNLKNDYFTQYYSFYRLRYDIADKKYTSPVKITLWHKLNELFRLINSGSQSLGISKEIFCIIPYSGALFNPIKYPKLEEWELGDSNLSVAIDLISRNQRLEFINYSELDIQHLGRIYESLIERGERKSSGSFYTPDNIVSIMIRNTLELVVQEKLKEAKKTGKNFVDAIVSIKVLDNAMGTGQFLIETVEFLAKKLHQAFQNDVKSGNITNDSSHTMNWAKKQVISHCIYGVDLNDFAVELSKMILWLTVRDKENLLPFLNHRIKKGNSLIGESLDDLGIIPSLLQDKDFELLKIIADIKTSISYGNPIKKETYDDFINRILDCSEKNLLKLKQKDFVIRSRQISKINLFFAWELEFPEVFFGEDNLGRPRTGFDVIIGNPPWASIRGKHSSHIFSDFDIAYLETKFPENTYMPNTYEYFILQSLKLLNKGGFHSYIVPDRLGFNKSVEYLRKILVNQYSLNSLIYKVPFPGVIVDTLIYSLTANNPNENHKIIVKEYQNDEVEITRKFYQSMSDTTFLFFRNKEIFDTLNAIDTSETIKLEDIAETTGGFGGKSNLLTNTRINAKQIEAVKGLNVERYVINGKHYFEFKKDNITGRTTDKIKLGAIPKILIRKTGAVLYSAYDNTGIYPEQSLYFLYNFKKDYSPFFVLSILNSSLFKFYYIEKLVTNRNTTPQIKKIHLDRFPIRKINFTADKAVVRNLYTKLIELYEIYLQKGSIMIFENIIDDEKDIVIHNFLAVLAQNMTEFKKSHSIKNSFKEKMYLTDKLIDFLVFQLYNLNSENIFNIYEDLRERGI